jgi:hypothetical protein
MADNTLPIIPGEGYRTQYTTIIGGVLNVLAIAVESFLGIDIPADAWSAANTLIGTLIIVFFADKSNRAETAANKAVAASAVEVEKIADKVGA